MIGFGELRRLATQWQTDIAAVERTYVTNWILGGIFSRAMNAFALRGSSALQYAYCPDYPFADEPELTMRESLDVSALLTDALRETSAASGLRLALVAFERGTARIEYTGPLGRRSAAQPRVTLTILAGQTRLPPVTVPLTHPFSDQRDVRVNAIALDEWIAERIPGLMRTPRARDVYDLWFALTHTSFDAASVNTLAREKKFALPVNDAIFDIAHRAVLERAWDGALHEARHPPTLAQTEIELRTQLHKFFSHKGEHDER